MTTARFQPIDHAVSLSLPADSADRLEQLKRASGLTWRDLASRLGVNDGGRGRDRPPSGAVHRAIVALARDLPGGCDRTTGDGAHDGEGD